ncbi:MAG: helix-turn-helix transcriptional regulator [Chitinispirillia bacterium]|nr:helix-turn-helix transcriptional regulator [Chitinispirillia bacterium]
MYPNLEAEQTRRGHTEEYVAEKLGMTRQTYSECKLSGAFQPAEALALVKIYDKPVEYLFLPKV